MTNLIVLDNTRYPNVEMELDTGTSEILLDEATYIRFTDLIGGPVTNCGGQTGILPQYYRKDKDTLTIEIGGKSYPLTMESLKTTGPPFPSATGCDRSIIWLRVDKHTQSILGAPFFKEYYVYFDEEKTRVGVGKNI